MKKIKTSNVVVASAASDPLKTYMLSERAELIDRQQNLINYLWSCARAQDWRGVRDAAADIDVVKARIESFDKYNPF